MLKKVCSFLCLFLLSSTMLLASGGQGMPPRPDKLDATSAQAQIKLQRAERILSTIVPDPQSYHLVLSSQSSFGGEAVSPGELSSKPTMIVYQGALSPDRSNEEIAFMMAHELGHLNLYHNERMGEVVNKIFNGPPSGYIGLPLTIYFQKVQEEQADMFGLHLYLKAGYDKAFFPYTLHLLNINPNIHYGTSKPYRKDLPSLSMKDSHYGMKDRFALLVQQSQLQA